MSGPLVLAIESSCDETAVALVEGGREIHANVVASQVALHAPTGGIVPEVAARAHLRWILPVLDEAWRGAGAAWSDVDAVAVTYGPGLAGSLLVGLNVAKTLAWVHGKPLVGVNHLEGHVYAAWLADPGPGAAGALGAAGGGSLAASTEPIFPLVALVVSGGHTFLVEMPHHLTYRLLGQTVDDAAGEAFDKVGRLLGLDYPGGPAIQRAAMAATRHDAAFPRAWLGDSYDFSFSGLKTAARRTIGAARADAGLRDDVEALPGEVTAELAWGFQDSVVDVLVSKTIRAARAFGARSIVLGGGVAANAALRSRLAGEAEGLGLPLIVPRPALCTDNGAMIGAAGARRFAAGERAGPELDARPSLPLAQ
jgi:N6-L-threonylcarbamoyladenine synthase